MGVLTEPGATLGAWAQGKVPAQEGDHGNRVMKIPLESSGPYGALLGAPHPMAQTPAVLC